jgi:hypothetical protein
MSYFTLSELMYLTCDELCDIAANIEHKLSRLEAVSERRELFHQKEDRRAAIARVGSHTFQDRTGKLDDQPQPPEMAFHLPHRQTEINRGWLVTSQIRQFEIGFSGDVPERQAVKKVSLR